MVEMVNTRRNAETKEERYDLFSGLLDAAEGDLDGAAAITEEELIGKCYLSYDIVHEKKFSLTTAGNIFIFLLAGHEVGPPHSSSRAF
jgi:hypothetical protein